MPRSFSARSAQPDDARVVQEFLQWYGEEREKQQSCDPDCVKKRAFMPRKRVESYFSRDYRTRTEDILSAILTEPNEVECETIEKGYRVVLAILLNIGQGRHITGFIQHDFSDAKLPLKERPRYFPRSGTGDFWEAFQERQWELCPVVFGAQKKKLEEHEVLPITDMEEITGGEGAAAKTYKIEIHPDGVDFRQAAPKSQDQTFVLKVSKRGNRDQFDKEEKAIQYLRKSVSTINVPIIEHYSTFEKDDYLCSILEYANGGNLEDFFQKKNPPVGHDDTLTFWTNLLDLLSGLMLIHDHKRRSDGSDIKGYHQDIKPTNILVVDCDHTKPFASRFKLADLGMSFFQPLAGSRARPHNHRSFSHAWRSSRTYGAPEHYDPYLEYAKLEHPADSASDVWSLGAILSEAAAWSRGGPQELNRYRHNRREEIKSDHGSQIYHEWAFHKEGKVLGCVQEKHEELCNTGEEVTQQVVREIVEKMLYPDHKGRPTAKYFNDIWNGRKIRLKGRRMTNAPDHGMPMQQTSPIAGASPEDPHVSALPPLRGTQTTVPRWAWNEAEIWAENRKKGLVYDNDPLEFTSRTLRKRDHIFILDDSEPMAEHWSQLVRNLLLLVRVLFYYDADDVIDIYFLIDPSHFEIKRSNLATVSAYLERRRPRVKKGFSATHPGHKLDDILKKQVSRGNRPGWHRRFNPLGHPLLPLSIYVLTDGKWASNATQERLLKVLRDFITDYPDIKDKHSEVDPTLGVQFIRFGDESTAMELLDRLDRAKQLGLLTVDVVDTEPWNGNVAKMLLGALDDLFDDDGTDSGSQTRDSHARTSTQGPSTRLAATSSSNAATSRTAESSTRPGHGRTGSLRNLLGFRARDAR